MILEDAQQVGAEWARYKLRQRMTELGSQLILYGVDVVLSPNPGKIVGALERSSKLKPRVPTRGPLTTLNDLSESLSIVGVLRDWFTKVPSLAGPIIDSQCNVMCCDGASDCWSTSLNCIHCGARGCVLKYNP